jgi:hypothetical protein
MPKMLPLQQSNTQQNHTIEVIDARLALRCRQIGTRHPLRRTRRA